MKYEPKWYKGPLTKRRLADLRKKLADARGMLSSLYVDERDPVRAAEIFEVLKKTADP